MVKLSITGAPLAGGNFPEAYFFAFDSTLLDHARPQTIERGPDGLTLTLTPGYDFQGASPPKELAGVLALEGKAYEVTVAAGPLPAAASGLGPPPAKVAVPAGAANLGLLSAAVFALIGGLILNLMPCVLPVLAIKLLGFAQHSRQHRAHRIAGMAYTTGVVLSFLMLGAGVLALRAAGEQLGWGFQLQSPWVVSVLAAFFMLIALNLFGLFELGQMLPSRLASFQYKHPVLDALLSGVLAVAVARVLSGPEMSLLGLLEVAAGLALTGMALTARCSLGEAAKAMAISSERC